MLKNKFLYIVIGVQLVLTLVGFWPHFSEPCQYLFHDQFDGFKNYTTLYTYVASGAYGSSGLTMYDQMNYPYGDFITYTDNTPFVAMFFKILVQMGIEPGTWILSFYNKLMIFNLVLSSLFLFFILKHFIKNEWLIVVASMALPWINPQLIRLSNGHFNLSQSWLLLMTILLLLELIKRSKRQMSLWPLGLCLVGAILLSSAYHVYYLPILGVIIGFFLVVYGLIQKYDLRVIYYGVGIPMAGLFLFWLITNLLDPNLGMRKEMQLGFNLDAWKLSFSSLFTAYPHFGVDFVVHGSQHHHYESNSYLGAYALFGGLLLFILSRFKKVTLTLKNDVVKALLITGLLSLLISLGTTIAVPSLGITIENFINPFYWLNKVTEYVSHFRCLGRFNWAFFWAFNFLILYLFDQNLVRKSGKWLKYVVYGMLVLLVVDAKDAIRFNNHERYKNVLTEHDLEDVVSLTKGIDPDDYEAILPIPYYHVGSQNWDYTYLTDGIFSRRIAQMSASLRLPQMSSIMSRTPLKLAQKQFNIFYAPEESALQDLKTNKALLVVVNDDLLQSDMDKAKNDQVPAHIKMLEYQHLFLQDSTTLRKITSQGAYSLYSYKPR